jgi:phosphoenolpyruvate-protein phosphotransferase
MGAGCEPNRFEGQCNLVFKGIAASPGMANGPAKIWIKQQVKIPRYTITDTATEHSRLVRAIATSKIELEGIRDKLVQEGHKAEAAVFDAHLLMLEDSSLLAMVDESLQKQSLNVEAAWNDAIQFFADQMDGIPDPTLQARAADIRDVGKRVIDHLLGVESNATLVLKEPSVVVARDLAPSETASLDKSKVLALCTAEGGATSHTAIFAKALGLPAVVGLGEKLLDIPSGSPLLVDGMLGEVIAFPDQGMRARFETGFLNAQQAASQEMSCTHDQAITKDGHRVEIVANIGQPNEAQIALDYGAEGVGLLRTEFLFLERKTAPNEEQQLAEYDKILDVMNLCPVVVRTIDVGGDKEIPYLNLGQEANPFLGWRAIRMCLDRPDFFKVQLRALLRSSPGHDLRIMFPMIATLAEIRQVKVLMEEARAEVLQAGHQVAEHIQVGIMVEIPSVAITADLFAREVDFFSIGTNDLTQYTMAAERTNPKVSHLGDACHPAVLRQIQNVIHAAHAAGIWVGVCGELAGDSDAVPILLGMGLDEFSMAPRAVPHAKHIIRQWTLQNALSLAQEVVNCDSAQAVRLLVQSRIP